jgi:hypothetical protein
MFGPLKRAARAFFVDELHLQRDERGLRVVLHGGQGPVLTAEERARQREEQRVQTELDAMRHDLAAVFDDIPGSRRALGHLAHVELQLREKGLALLDQVPLNLLRQALHELENAVSNWSSTGLATLRSKMAVAVRTRELNQSEHEQDVRLSRAQLPLPEVSESRVERSATDPDQAALLAAYGAVDVDLDKPS